MSYRFVEAPPDLVADIRAAPRAILDHFVFVAVDQGGRTTHHALGYRGGLPYITSALLAVDPSKHRIRTASGSVYAAETQADAPELPLLGHLQVALEQWGVPA